MQNIYCFYVCFFPPRDRRGWRGGGGGGGGGRKRERGLVVNEGDPSVPNTLMLSAH